MIEINGSLVYAYASSMTTNFDSVVNT